MRRLMRCVLLASLVAVVHGCRAPDPIPVYADQPLHESLVVIKQRTESVTDISGQGDVTLTDVKGQGVTLDGTFVFAPPDRARVRASKFGQAVLDLTVTQDETWLFLARGDEHAEQLRSTSAQIGKAIRQWLSMLSSIASDAGEIVGATLVVKRQLSDGLTIVCTIDRATLTARRYQLIDATGRVRLTLDTEAYQLIGTTVWPTVIRATAPGGRVEIKLSNLEANAASPAAFKHPARAERLP